MKVHQKTNFARFAIIAKLILILSDQIFNLFDMIDLEAHVFVFRPDGTIQLLFNDYCYQ